MQQLITIQGYWKDTKEPISRLCKIDARANPNHWAHQQFLWDLDSDADDDIFYYFEPDEHIIGDKGDFIVYKFKMENEPC
jgi:hypothetical protein